jgi:LysM repeat protein
MMKTVFKHIAALSLLLFSAQWASAQADSYFLHTVTKGQGLYSISRMYGVTEEAIIALNPGSETVIKVGEQLRIPQNKVVETTTTTQNEEARFHTIKTGETLYRLTVIYNLTAKEICDANPGLSAESFKVGQVVTIPKKKSEEPAASATPSSSTSKAP